MSTTDIPVVTISTFDEAKDTYRQKDLRQALYDAGEVIMGDVLVNLHGAEHRDRRRLENRLFRRETFELYERTLFPPIISETIAPHVATGRAELVDLGHQMMMNLAASTAGVDRPLGTPEETHRLYDYLMRFIEGATLAHFTGDEMARFRARSSLSSFRHSHGGVACGSAHKPSLAVRADCSASRRTLLSSYFT